MRKLASKLRKKDLISINKIVSRRAVKLGVSSEAALVILAKENGIGSAVYQRSLDGTKQAEIREALSITSGNSDTTATKKTVDRFTVRNAPPVNKRAALKSMIECLVSDPELLDRCCDILMAKRNFDRAVNQAPQVLEERIRNKAQPPTRMVGEPLV